MKIAAISAPSGKLIHMRAAQMDGAILIECLAATDFLNLIANTDYWSQSETWSQSEMPVGAKVRGVIIPDQGGFFDLFDIYGLAVKNIVKLSADEAQRRIVDNMIWEVELH
jgi:hypothetical protein